MKLMEEASRQRNASPIPDNLGKLDQDTIDALFQDFDEKKNDELDEKSIVLSSTPVSEKKKMSRNNKTNNSLSMLSTQEKLQMCSWGLPGKLMLLYFHRNDQKRKKKSLNYRCYLEAIPSKWNTLNVSMAS